MMLGMEHDRLSAYTDSQLATWRSFDYMRWLQVLYTCNNSALAAAEDFPLRHPRAVSADLVKQIPALITKAGVTPGTSTDTAWAAPIAVPRPLTDPIVAMSRDASLFGKLGDLVRSAPLNVSFPVQSQGGGATFSWVAPGGILPVGNMSLSTMTMTPGVAGGILIVTKELLTVSTPPALTMLRNDLVRGLSTFMDDALLSTSAANAATGAPAGILSAAPSFGSAGSSLANQQTDIKKLLGDFTATNPDVGKLVIIASPAVAAKLALATGSQTLTMQGGTIYGATVATSASAGNKLIALDADALVVADDGGLDVDISQAAAVEMNTAPTSPQVAGTVLVAYGNSD